MQAANRLIRFLREHRRSLNPLLILTHNHPDPDAVASAFALAHLAKSVARIRSRIVHGGIIGRTENRAMVRLLRIPIRPLRSELLRHPTVALVDTQPSFGNNPFPKTGRQPALIIDHHPAAVPCQADCCIIHPEVGATSVILAQAVLQAGCSIPAELATALVYGILSETQDLGRETRELEIRTYRQILPWCDLRSLALIQNPQKPRDFFRVVRRSLDRAFVRGELIGTHLGVVSTPDRVSQTADFLLACEGIRWSFCTGRYRGRLHVSLRALRPVLHAGRLLQKVLAEKERAGGHACVAGGSLPVESPQAESRWRRCEERVELDLVKHLYKGRIPPKRFPFHG